MQMLCICWNVLFVAYDMLVAPARLSGLGLIITRRAVVSLVWGPQYPRRNSSDILLKEATRGSFSFFIFIFISFKSYLKLVFTIVDNKILIHTNYLQERYTLYKRKNH